jgi:hypothetical protein
MHINVNSNEEENLKKTPSERLRNLNFCLLFKVSNWCAGKRVLKEMSTEKLF